ncbi:MAG TPA: hypothetical protein VIF62_10990 [Labilithrix sp.]|jgi:hypothetical protein
MDRNTHQRYLDYRDRHGYFGAQQKVLGMDEFAKLDAEHAALAAREGQRDDDEEERFAELTKLLLRD